MPTVDLSTCPKRLFAGLHSVYDAVYDEDERTWSIRNTSYAGELVGVSEESYPTPYAALLAFERTTIRYREPA